MLIAHQTFVDTCDVFVTAVGILNK
jgi:cation diffusion facilitator CzcD-associated flavoprotein CzcO